MATKLFLSLSAQQRANTFRSIHTLNGRSPGGLKGNGVVGMRRETKNRWERRAPLTPHHVRTLVHKGIAVLVQPSKIRIFTDEEFLRAGAVITEDLSPASLIVGVKEVPLDQLIPERTYMCFSHTIKAQEYNMKMLDAMIEKNVRLIDYETMVDAQGKRVIGFGKFAGYAGMIDALRGLGDRLLGLGYSTPFLNMGYTDSYASLAACRTAVQLVGDHIQIGGIPRDLAPLVFAFTGSGGNVTEGAVEIFQELPHMFVDPSDLPELARQADRNVVYGVMLERHHCVAPKDMSKPFDKAHFYKHPSQYNPIFHERIAPYITCLINGVYWDPAMPRLLSVNQMRELHDAKARLIAIADISADPYGGIEFTRECTKIDNPFVVYNPHTQEESYKWDAPGVLLGSVDNLPAELPREASLHFGSVLANYIYMLAKSDGTKPLDAQTDISPTLRNAIICDKGSLTPRFKYIADLREKKERIRAQSHKRVLLLGAGMVTAPLVEYLNSFAEVDCKLTIAADNLDAAKFLSSRYPGCAARQLDVSNSSELERAVAEHDVVVSLIPASLHPLVARACIAKGVNMVTSSYISPDMESLHDSAKQAGVTIMNEIGLDPGIDHLSALKTIHDVRAHGGTIKSFVSWCGGLPAPEASCNPLGYKFSWSVRGVLNAGLNSARWRENGKELTVPRGQLFKNARHVDLFPALALEGLPNRDSLSYEGVYGLEGCETMLRGTLRYKGFSVLMNAMLELGLMNDQPDARLAPGATRMTWADFMSSQLKTSDPISDVRKRFEEPSIASGLSELGLFSNAPVAQAGTPIDALCDILGKRLSYEPGERDTVLMMHRFGIEYENGRKEMRTSTLARTGDNTHTAMALTVGLPAAIATELMLQGRITEKGVLRPVAPHLCDTILSRLAQQGVNMIEAVQVL